MSLFNSLAPSGILNELAVRIFTGSRDVPKDNGKAIQLFSYSEENAKTENEYAQVHYYQLLMRKFKIHQETILHGKWHISDCAQGSRCLMNRCGRWKRST